MNLFVGLFQLFISSAQVENPLENPRNYKTGKEMVTSKKPKVEAKKKVITVSRNYKAPMKLDTVVTYVFLNGSASKRNYKQH